MQRVRQRTCAVQCCIVLVVLDPTRPWQRTSVAPELIVLLQLLQPIVNSIPSYVGMWNVQLSPYVALSRSSGRSSIRLLRDFDSKVFQAAHSPDLLTEDDRLKALDAETQK